MTITEDDIRRWISYQLEPDGSIVEIENGVEYLDEQNRVGLVIRDVDGGVWDVICSRRA